MAGTNGAQTGAEIGADGRTSGRPTGREAEGRTAATPRTGPAPSGTEILRRLESLERVQRLQSEGGQSIVSEQRRHEARLDGLTGNLRELVGVVDRLTVQAQALAERVEKLERWTGVPMPASEVLDERIGHEASGNGQWAHDAAQPRTAPAASGTNDSPAASGTENTPHETAARPEQSGPPPVLRSDLTDANRRLLDKVGEHVRSGLAEADCRRATGLMVVDRDWPGTLEITARLLAVGKVLAMLMDGEPPHVVSARLAGWGVRDEDAETLARAWRLFDSGRYEPEIVRDRVDEDAAMARVEQKRREAVEAQREGGAA